MLYQLLKIFIFVYHTHIISQNFKNGMQTWLFELIPVASQEMRLLTVKSKEIRGSRNSVRHNHIICLVTGLCAR
jgi:hypothetical protein